MNNVDLDWIERNFLPVIGFPAASPAGSIVNGDNAEKEGRKEMISCKFLNRSIFQATRKKNSGRYPPHHHINLIWILPHLRIPHTHPFDDAKLGRTDL